MSVREIGVARLLSKADGSFCKSLKMRGKCDWWDGGPSVCSAMVRRWDAGKEEPCGRSYTYQNRNMSKGDQQRRSHAGLRIYNSHESYWAKYPNAVEILIDITHLVHTSFDTRESARIPKKKRRTNCFLWQSFRFYGWESGSWKVIYGFLLVSHTWSNDGPTCSIDLCWS